jgi:hypothetical protein
MQADGSQADRQMETAKRESMEEDGCSAERRTFSQSSTRRRIEGNLETQATTCGNGRGRLMAEARVREPEDEVKCSQWQR